MKILSSTIDVNRFKCENAVVDELVSFLSKSGYRVRLEVPNMSQSADVVATRNGWVTVIEAKVKNWKRAIQQCKNHRPVADFICIAIATKKVSDLLIEEVETLGYGLIHCSPISGMCKWIIEPKRNQQVWVPQREMLSKAMKDINYVN